MRIGWHTSWLWWVCFLSLSRFKPWPVRWLIPEFIEVHETQNTNTYRNISEEWITSGSSACLPVLSTLQPGRFSERVFTASRNVMCSTLVQVERVSDLLVSRHGLPWSIPAVACAGRRVMIRFCIHCGLSRWVRFDVLILVQPELASSCPLGAVQSACL